MRQPLNSSRRQFVRGDVFRITGHGKAEIRRPRRRDRLPQAASVA